MPVSLCRPRSVGGGVASLNPLGITLGATSIGSASGPRCSRFGESPRALFFGADTSPPSRIREVLRVLTLRYPLRAHIAPPSAQIVDVVDVHLRSLSLFGGPRRRGIVDVIANVDWRTVVHRHYSALSGVFEIRNALTAWAVSELFAIF